MPNLPEDASLVDLAKDIGASEEEVATLPANVTKGQLLALWGAADTQSAVSAYNDSQHGQQLPAPSAAGESAPLHLTLQDVAAIQNVFTPERVQSSLGAAPDEAGGLAEPADDSGSVSCCCCTPCCTSATALADTEAQV